MNTPTQTCLPGQLTPEQLRNRYLFLYARSYDPSIGRFSTLDPFGGNDNDPQSLHKYMYANGNPVMGIDPSGEFASYNLVGLASVVSSLNVFMNVVVLANSMPVIAGRSLRNKVAIPIAYPSAIPISHLMDARLADDVYNNTSQLPFGMAAMGWTEVAGSMLANLGLKSGDFTAYDGFFARLYFNSIMGQYVLSFRGTQILSAIDWYGNFCQGLFGTASQYNHAASLASKVRAGIPQGASLSTTGHSLGGGLASVAAIAINGSGVTFNAAGPHPSMISRIGGASSSASVIAYHVRGEFLNSLQDSINNMPQAFGVRYQLLPSASDAGTVDAGNLHRMKYVLRALGL